MNETYAFENVFNRDKKDGQDKKVIKSIFNHLCLSRPSLFILISIFLCV